MLPKRSIQCGFRIFGRDAEAISNTVGPSGSSSNLGSGTRIRAAR